MGDPLERLEKWMDRLLDERVDHYANVEQFVQKIRRVLAGEETLGVTPCAVCGETETHRAFLPTERRVRGRNGGAVVVVPADVDIVVCYAHRVEKEDRCPCGEVLWSLLGEVGDPCEYSTESGEAVTACPGCGVPLARTTEEWNVKIRDIYARVGYVRRVPETTTKEAT